MNMLSAQVDRLRELATRCNELQVGATRVVRVPLNMGSILSDAADTILELRDDLQQANTENAKLQETLRRRTEQLDGMTEMWVERGVENYKLRELFYEAWEWMQHARWHDSICADKLDEIGIKASKLGLIEED